MNALLAQFLEEGADLLERVERGLLALERDPGDAETLHEVFRAAHTFKGSSGLFDLPELTRLTHACEDVLDRAREGELAITPEVVDRLNAAFDLVRDWLAYVADHEVLPSSAAADGAEQVRRLRAHLGEPSASAAPSTAPTAVAPNGPWRITYRPATNAFFRGEDPLHLVSQIPGLRSLDVEPSQPWPPVEDLDEYECVVVFTAVADASRDELEHLFRFCADEVTFEVDTADGGPVVGPAVPAAVAAVLSAQRLLLLGTGDGDGREGRIRSAAGVLRRVVARAGGDAGAVDRAERTCLDTAAVDALVAVVDAVLAGRPPWVTGDAGRTLLAGADDPAEDPADDATGDVDDATRGTAAGAATAPMARPLKVDQEKVDRLLELAGELVVAKNALPFLARQAEEVHGAGALARQIKDQYAAMNRLAEELQHAVMDIRMLPVSTAWQRFPRLVRDLARKLGKQVRLVTEGDHTRADKDVLELIGDPLLHLVRNSLDHGLEPAAERTANGKPAEGTLRLSASQEADSVLIVVSDDGRGIDPGALRHKAVARGLLTAERAQRMTDREALQLVFLAGFSTAEVVSDISGRGVGMDVVRSTIVRLGGDLSLDSTPGVGTRVTVKLPLTMSVMSVMTVSAGGHRFGIPLDLVQETVKVPRGSLGSIQRRPTINLRRGLVPVVDLAESLDLRPSPAREDLTVCVVRIDGRDVGLAIDGFHENVDVILKPLEGVMRNLRSYAGTALMGDGDVLLVLDPREVVRHAAAA